MDVVFQQLEDFVGGAKILLAVVSLLLGLFGSVAGWTVMRVRSGLLVGLPGYGLAVLLALWAFES